MRPLQRTAFALALALAPWAADAETSVGTAPRAALARIHTVPGAFRAAFPSEPRSDESSAFTLLGRLRSQGWEVEDADVRLRVERHEVPALALAVLGGAGLLARAEALSPS